MGSEISTGTEPRSDNFDHASNPLTPQHIGDDVGEDLDVKDSIAIEQYEDKDANKPEEDKSRNKSKGKGRGKKSKRKPLWNELEDASSGDKYFYNRVTKVTTWTRPSEYELGLFCEHGSLCDADGNPVIEVDGEESPLMCSHNHSELGESNVEDKIIDVAEAMALANKIFEKHRVEMGSEISTGTEPRSDNFDHASNPLTPQHIGDDVGEDLDVKDSIAIEQYEDKDANKPEEDKSRNKSKGKGRGKKSKRKPLWNELEDASSGDKYFYNRVTKVTTWTRPSEYELGLFCEHGSLCDADGNFVESFS